MKMETNTKLKINHWLGGYFVIFIFYKIVIFNKLQTITIFKDLKNEQQVKDVIIKCNIEIIFHLGAQALVPVAYHNPRETIETNIGADPRAMG